MSRIAEAARAAWAQLRPRLLEWVATQRHNAVEVWLLVDQGLGLLLAILMGRRGYADETMSAHCWRAFAERKWFARVLMPVIDFLFSWQAVDPSICDENGIPIRGHCRRAFERERALFYLPPAYRSTPTPPSHES